MILNATSEYRVVFLYLFCITIFRHNILSKVSRCHHGGGLGAENRDNCPRCPP